MAMLRLLARERIGLAVVPTIMVQDELKTCVLVEIAPLPQLRETAGGRSFCRPRRAGTTPRCGAETTV